MDNTLLCPDFCIPFRLQCFPFLTKKQASGFLIKRGLWLIFVEIAIINFAFSFDPSYHFIGLQVIWAIGCSMIFLAALIYLKPLHVGIIGLFIIFSHNILDGIQAGSFGKAKILWMILHEQNFIPYGEGRFFGVLYPIIPWIGVMATGYAFGWFFTIEKEKRTKWFLKIGWSCITLFILIRFSNIYGESRPWKLQDTWWKTILSFIDCRKYPPSLLYLLMTIGPSIILLNVFEQYKNKFTTILTVYGNVPFFYYVLHFFLIHLAAVLTSVIMGIKVGTIFNPTPGWGFGLPIVYAVWLCIVAVLYLPCKWFMGVKQRRKDWWLSYL